MTFYNFAACLERGISCCYTSKGIQWHQGMGDILMQGKTVSMLDFNISPSVDIVFFPMIEKYDIQYTPAHKNLPLIRNSSLGS